MRSQPSVRFLYHINNRRTFDKAWDFGVSNGASGGPSSPEWVGLLIPCRQLILRTGDEIGETLCQSVYYS